MSATDFRTWREWYLADHGINPAEVFFKKPLTDKNGIVVFTKLTINQLLDLFEGDPYTERNLKRVICMAVQSERNVSSALNEFVLNEIELGNTWFINELIKLSR